MRPANIASIVQRSDGHVIRGYALNVLIGRNFRSPRDHISKKKPELFVGNISDRSRILVSQFERLNSRVDVGG